MGGEGGDLLPFGHRRAARHPGDDDRLGDAGQRIFHAERSRRAAEGADPRRHVIGDARFLQQVDLLPDCAVERGVARVQAHRRLPAGLGGPHDREHLFQSHPGAVMDFTVRLDSPEQGGVHKGTRIDYDIRLGQQPVSPQGDQVGRAAARPHKMHHQAVTPLPR